MKTCKRSTRRNKTIRKLFRQTPHVNKKNDICNNSGCKNVEFSRNSLGRLPRRSMPQFSSVADMKRFFGLLPNSLGCKVTISRQYVPIVSLMPSQSEINSTRVMKIFKSWPKNKSTILDEINKPTPIMTSSAGSIIDGHHRVEALKLAIKHDILNSNQKIWVISIDLPAWTILSTAIDHGFNASPQVF